MSQERDDRIDSAGRLLAEAWRDARTIDALPEGLFPSDVAQATAIQDAMARHIGQEVVGWKVGGAPGPLVGRVFEPSLISSPATLPASRFPTPNLECEFGFRLLGDLPPRQPEYGREEVMNAAALTLTLELTGSRFTDGKHSPETDEDLRAIVADNAAHAALIVGPGIRDWRDLSLLDIAVELRIDGGPILPMQPRENRNHPFDILVWLANELSRRGIGLKAGQIVSTGSATVPQPLRPGNTVRAAYADLGEVMVTLAGQ